jgi:two-component system nitrate/nitrite response regulator NarL
VPAPVRLLLVGDDAVARAGLRAIADAAGLAVAGEATTEDVATDGGSPAFEAILWDVGPTGAAEALRSAAARLPVVAVLWRDDQLRDALSAGARGVLSRERVEEQLPAAVQAAVSGLVAIDPALIDGIAPRVPAATALVEALTPREMEVLQLLASGLTNRRIGERLGISEHTAKFHVNAILGKLQASNRGEAIANAVRLGLLML